MICVKYNRRYNFGRRIDLTLAKQVPGSRWDPAEIPGAHRDPAEVAHFPGGILPRKNSRRVSPQESRRKICTCRDPAKRKTLLRDPGENPAGKQNLDSICGENITLAE